MGDGSGFSLRAPALRLVGVADDLERPIALHGISDDLERSFAIILQEAVLRTSVVRQSIHLMLTNQPLQCKLTRRLLGSLR